MYFHNAATHRHSRVPAAPKLSWEPFHLSYQPPVFETGRCLELQEGSVALPRSSRGRAAPVHLHPPSGVEEYSVGYVLSWPPSISSPTLSSPSSPSSSDSSTTSVYYTPLNTASFSTPSTVSLSSSRPIKPAVDFFDLSDTENFPPLQAPLLRQKVPACRPAGYKRRTQPTESGLKGWARLRRNAPPALRMQSVEEELAGSKQHYVLEFEGAYGVALPQPKLRCVENTPEHRFHLLDLLMNGS